MLIRLSTAFRVSSPNAAAATDTLVNLQQESAMPRATTDYWATSIAEVHDDDVNVRGHWLTDLMNRVTFAEMAFLLLTGREAGEGERRVLDALFVSIAEHGISPSSTVARQMASYGVPIQVGIAAGQLSVGDHHGGAGEQIAQTLQELVAAAQLEGRDGPAAAEARLRTLADEHVRRTRRQGEPVHGFGHPHHGTDPRVAILAKLAQETGVAGAHCDLIFYIEDALEEAVGRRIACNIDGISAALLSDMGMDPRAARPLLMAPRVIGLAAHFIEEENQGNKWRHVPQQHVTYEGPQAKVLR